MKKGCLSFVIVLIFAVVIFSLVIFAVVVFEGVVEAVVEGLVEILQFFFRV